MTHEEYVVLSGYKYKVIGYRSCKNLCWCLKCSPGEMDDQPGWYPIFAGDKNKYYCNHCEDLIQFKNERE